MDDTPTLTGPTLAPASGGRAQQLVILLHGVGSDGDDLIGLAPYFQKVLPDALFVSPHAPFPFDMAPQGHQWFSLQERTPETRLAGVQTAAPILDAFIDAQLAETGLNDGNLALVGFSQGTMMALHVGLRRASPMAGILGYSGMLVGHELLADAIRSRPPVMLAHGEADDVVPVAALPDAVAGLEAAGVSVRHHTSPGLGHGLDDDGIRLGMEFLAEVFGIDLETMAREQSPV
ncbi:MAG: prolyl oligopeptidase family serine peptidase [Rhodospirillales bacterium]|nr:prolyl oligopeptidase family serine peptidase [Alphaproteobacteria bacterium]MBL6947081.1 prolyl oligopeptidase family serine peptidase [Rhodospirillales bacterium]